MTEARRPIAVHVNGEPRPAVDGVPLRDFIIGLGLNPVGVLIERNGTALLRGEWEQTRVCEGDRLEILRVVAGG